MSENFITETNFNKNNSKLVDMYNKQLMKSLKIENYDYFYEYTNCVICKNLKAKNINKENIYELKYYCDEKDCISNEYVSEKLLECVFIEQLEDIQNYLLNIKLAEDI